MTSLNLGAPTAAVASPVDPMAPARHAIGFMTMLAVPTLIAYGLDDRLLHGISVWWKPLKFEVSLSLHFVTLIWLARLLSTDARQSRLLRRSMLAAATMAVLEISYIALQAARGRASHFNFETPLEQALYSLMGVGATVIVAGSFVFGWLIWRSRPAVGDGQSGLRNGAVLGLILGSLATLAIGGYLGSQSGHWIGGPSTDASGLPLTGWSTTGGDLRPGHFLATHMMQVMPVFGLIADRLRLRSSAVWIAAALYLTLVAAITAQALSGAPLLAR
jgi:hypothetical protein